MHDLERAELLGEQLDVGSDLLLGVLLVVIGSDVAQQGDAGVLRRGRAAPAVLDGNALAGLEAEHLAGVEVDGGVGLGSRGVDAARGGEDALVGLAEVLVDLDGLDGGDDTGHGGGGDDGLGVLALLVDLVEDGDDVLAGRGLLAQVRDGELELAGGVGVELVGGHGEVVHLEEAGHHAGEVAADVLVHELDALVALLDAVLLEDLVGELRAGGEGRDLGQHERVVAVEEDALNLRLWW